MKIDLFPQWMPRSKPMLLADDEVHVWRALCDLSPAYLTTYESLLSPDEKARAHRFYFERDRNRFIAHRGILRILLGNYLQIEPAEVRFFYNPQGKPLLKDFFENQSFHFNLSHSKNMTLYAFTIARAIGIDIEALRKISAAEAIARRYFTAKESQVLKEIPEKLKDNKFLQLWTSKESYIKAVGKGLSMSLNQFEAAHVLGWSIESFFAAQGYIAALAIEGEIWKAKFFEFNPS